MIKNVHLDNMNIISDQQGKPTSAEFCAEVVNEILEPFIKRKTFSGIYHLTNSTKLTWLSFAKKIFQIVEKNFSIKTPTLNSIQSSQYDSTAIRPKNSVLSTHKIEKVFGIKIPPIDKYLEQSVITIYKSSNKLK